MNAISSNTAESFPVNPQVEVPGFSSATTLELAKRVDRYAGLNLGELMKNQDLTPAPKGPVASLNTGHEVTSAA